MSKIKFKYVFLGMLVITLLIGGDAVKSGTWQVRKRSGKGKIEGIDVRGRSLIS